MKKGVLLVALLATFGLAQAVEVGVFGAKDESHQDQGKNHSHYGLTVSEQIGKVSVEGEYSRMNQSGNNQDKYSVIAGYDVYKLGFVTLTPKVGASYLNNAGTTADGYAVRVGLGASAPLADHVKFGVDFYRQYGQDRVNAYDGNTVQASIKYAF
jgi:hypothetical protein